MANKEKVLIFIVSYSAEKSITSVLQCIPDDVWENEIYDAEVLVIDDESPDETFYRAVDYQRLYPHHRSDIYCCSNHVGLWRLYAAGLVCF